MREKANFRLVFLLVPVLGLILSPSPLAEEAGRPDLPQPILEAYELITERYHDPDSLEEKELVRGAIEGMLEALPDEYNRLYTEAEYESYRKELEGEYVGLGIEIADRDGAVEVVGRFPDTPAAEAGLGVGDLILSVDGNSTEEMSVEEASEAIAGEAGSEVSLRIERPGGGQREVTLTRKEVKIPPVVLKFISEGKIAVLDVNLFGRSTPEELESRLRELERKRGLAGYVLDLRNNSGGLLSSSLSVASKFVDEGVITELVGPDGSSEKYESSGNSVPNLPLVVLINGGTASASELVAAAIREHGMGVLVGRDSFGKGLVQTTHTPVEGLKIKLSSSRYLTPAGEGIPEDGLEPDLRSEDRTEDMEVAGRWIEEHRGERTPVGNGD